MKIIKINAMWCPGCISMHKVWSKVKEQYPTLEIEEYDYDMDEEIVKTFNIGKLLPVTIFMKNEKEVGRLNGEKTFEEIVNMIEGR